MTRTDLVGGQGTTDGVGAEESPLGIRPFQAYRFTSTQYGLRLAVAPVVARTTAEVQTVVKLSDFERTLETRVNVEAAARRCRTVEPAQTRLVIDAGWS